MSSTFPDYSSSFDYEEPPPTVFGSASNGSTASSGAYERSRDSAAFHGQQWGKSERNIYANRYRDTSKRFRGIWNLMAMWKGSVFKLVRRKHATIG